MALGLKGLDNPVIDKDQSLETSIPKKLNIPKSSRLELEPLDDKTKAYCDATTTKLRNLKPKAIQNVCYRNNLTTDMQKSLNKIKELLRSKQIVICRADKDGKILITDYDEYDAIML